MYEMLYLINFLLSNSVCSVCDLQILDALDIDPYCKKMHLAHKLENVACTLEGEETSTCWRRESPDLLLANLYWDKMRRDCDMLHAHVNCDSGDSKWCEVLICSLLGSGDGAIEQGYWWVNERVNPAMAGWMGCLSITWSHVCHLTLKRLGLWRLLGQSECQMSF